MKKEIFRLVFGCTLSLVVGLAVAQNKGSNGGSGGGQTGGSTGGTPPRSGGGGGYTGGGQGGSVNRPMNGGNNSGNSGSNRSSGGQNSGGTNRTGTGSNSRYGDGSNTSRYQSHQGQGSGSRTGGYSGSRSTGGYSGSRTTGGYSGGRTMGGNFSSSRSGGYTGRNGSAGGGSTYDRSYGSNISLDRGHANESRTGHVTYSGNNNKNGMGHAIDGTAKFGHPHRGLIGPSIVGKVIGGNVIGLVHGGWRTGYFGYGVGWQDSFFCYPFYIFDPWMAPCYCSPWYYYPCLPAYIAAPQVIIVEQSPNTNWQGEDHEWTPGTPDSTNPVLDDSIQDLVQAFEADDHKAIDRVTPHSGNVAIYADGKYSYSLKANDFYDTYLDGIESTKTDRYEVLDVKASKDGTSARVTTKHVYNDPWGNRTYIYHSYFMVKEGDEYVIREFGTSDNQTGY